MAAFLHLLPRRIRTHTPRSADSPWFSRQQPTAAGLYLPETWKIEGGVITHEIEPGDTLWVIGWLRAPEGADPDVHLPAALDARIEVAAIRRGPAQSHIVQPAPGSRWFPLADATEVLAQLRCPADEAGGQPDQPLREPRPIFYSTLERCLRQPYPELQRLVDAGPLQRHAQRLETEPYDYISYRQADGTRQAFELVRSLMAEGGMVFWDRWGLPPHLAELREVGHDAALEQVLQRQLDGACTVLGVETERYREEGSYTLQEAQWAEIHGRYQGMQAQPRAPSSPRDPWLLSHPSTLDRLPPIRRAADTTPAPATDQVLASKQAAMRQHIQAVARENTTRRQAREQLEALGVFGPPPPAHLREPTDPREILQRAAKPTKKAPARKRKPRRYYGLGIRL